MSRGSNRSSGTYSTTRSSSRRTAVPSRSRAHRTPRRPASRSRIADWASARGNRTHLRCFRAGRRAAPPANSAAWDWAWPSARHRRIARGTIDRSKRRATARAPTFTVSCRSPSPSQKSKAPACSPSPARGHAHSGKRCAVRILLVEDHGDTAGHRAAAHRRRPPGPASRRRGHGPGFGPA